MEVVKKNAEKLGLQIKVFEFSDYIAPNVALDTGDIDINSFQHQPYLDRQIKDRHYKIESVAKTIISPLVFFTTSMISACPPGLMPTRITGVEEAARAPEAKNGVERAAAAKAAKRERRFSIVFLQNLILSSRGGGPHSRAP